jgi:hypothetical protein
MTAPTVYRFLHAEARVHDAARFIETVFADGARCPAIPHDNPAVDSPFHIQEQRDTAAALGYGGADPVWAMVREHDLAHSFLAERLGWPLSITLWCVAHQLEATIPEPLRLEEEAQVFDFIRVVNGLPPERSWPADIQAAAAEFRERFRVERAA